MPWSATESRCWMTWRSMALPAACAMAAHPAGQLVLRTLVELHGEHMPLRRAYQLLQRALFRGRIRLLFVEDNHAGVREVRAQGLKGIRERGGGRVRVQQLQQKQLLFCKYRQAERKIKHLRGSGLAVIEPDKVERILRIGHQFSADQVYIVALEIVLCAAKGVHARKRALLYLLFQLFQTQCSSST